MKLRKGTQLPKNIKKRLKIISLLTLSATEQAFLTANLTADIRALLLGKQPEGVDLKKVAAQLLARQKAREKLPAWYASNDLVFPPALSVEQASSERTAAYKAGLVSGKLLLDLTGGMGIDTWAFARRIDQVVYAERQTGLAELAAYNLPLMGATNVQVRVGDGLVMLENNDLNSTPADWLYLDPHRRDAQGGRVVSLQDCEPDLTQPGLVTKLLTHARCILIKTSPLLDVGLAVQQLGGLVGSVHVVAVQGEVKEVLLVLTNQAVNRDNITVNAVSLTNDGAVMLSFQGREEQGAAVRFGDPQRYLYEPNAAVLKAGAFRLVAARFGLTKLAPNSHLYTSHVYQPDFPGRVFELKDVLKPDSKTLKKIVPDLKANLTVRNFPQTVAELRKKLSLREGGDIYIFATTLLNGDKRLLVTHKITIPSL